MRNFGFDTLMLTSAELSEPPTQSVITPAVQWLENLVFGTAATIIAVIAIASIGFAMLAGRIPLRRGATIILGCFILFGAKSISEGLRSTMPENTVSQNAGPPPPPTFIKPPVRQPEPATFDPYAGASVPVR